MSRLKPILGLLVLALAGWLLVSVQSDPPDTAQARTFTSSRQCQECHAQIYEEWSSSEHANSWTGEDVRTLSNNFANKDCIDCHAPRPVFETGIGERVLPRSSRRAEGVDCITCHQLPEGGMAGTISSDRAACMPVERRELARVELCVSCHDQHETVKQWRATPYPDAGIDCLTCHMPYTDNDPTKGRDHRCLGGHDIALVRTAVELRGAAGDNGWTIEVENVAGGHHFPTDERSRAADVFWRPLAEPQTVPGRWFHLYRFRSPYRDEVGVPDTLLPFGETRSISLEHDGPVEVALFYNLRPVYLDPVTAEPWRLEDVLDPALDARLVHRMELR